MQFEIPKLKESNEFLNSVIDNLNSAVFLVDKDVKIVNLNDAFTTLFQKSEDKIIGELCGNAIGCSFTVDENKYCGATSNCGKCNLRKAIVKALTQKEITYKERLTRDFYIKNKPIYKHFIFTTKLIKYHSNDVVVLIIDDITEIEEQKLKLENLNNLKNEFLGMAAHDLRNPIGAIKMFSSYLIDFGSENLVDQQKLFIERINKSSDFMLHLLEDLLDISKIEAGKLELRFSKRNYMEFVKQIIEINKSFADNKNISIDFVVKDNIPDFNFDSDKIEQVLNNLLSNATKYSHPDTKIIVEIKKQKKEVLTSVIDQGQGIPKKELPLVFKEFQKLSVKSTAGEKSTGLGLAIARKIVEGHKGKIGVESKVDKGSNFHFTLPIIE